MELWTCAIKLRSFWSLVLIFSVLLRDCESLRNVKVRMPLAVKTRTSAAFQCLYDLEDEPLYTVKWYKGTKELFRFVPREDPNMQIFPMTGIHVDLSRSSVNELTLIDVGPEATGRYKCEVSTDAPNFDTQQSSGYLHVIDVPDQAPILEIRRNLNGGYMGVVEANCTTPPSYPTMNVTWLINGIRVRESGRRSVSLDPISAFGRNKQSPLMTVSHLAKEIDDNMFQAGVIKIQCIATLFNLYKSENVRYIEDGRPQPWPSSVIGQSANSAGQLLNSGILVFCSRWIWVVGILQTSVL